MIKNPDPRVKWAMQIMDQEGEVCTLVSILGWVVCSRGLKSCSYFERFDINKLFVSGVHWNGWPCLHSIHLWNSPCGSQFYQECAEQGSSEVLTIFVYKIFWDVFAILCLTVLQGQTWQVQSWPPQSHLVLGSGMQTGWREGQTQ